MQHRPIIEIDEEKCDGCGQCILACAEGALELVDGKARLVGEIYCDGLGACLGECPQGALKVIERPAEEFDEEAVEGRLSDLKKKSQPQTFLACGCPSSEAMIFKPAPAAGPATGGTASSLGHFPIKLQLLGPDAPFLKKADLLLLADCTATAYPGLHARLLPGRAVALGCPKLDDLEAHIVRLAEIIKHADLKSITVVHMEVPCCQGFVHAAQQALERAGVALPLGRIKISRSGEILEEEDVPWAA
ncbi:MAG: 4Fe-4S binding protein [Deltaproteobacteria bacterium]|nr:4Fe-4S binding protein [Deltaproteobacteria bacterium]